MTHERDSTEPSWSRANTVAVPAYAAAQASYIRITQHHVMQVRCAVQYQSVGGTNSLKSIDFISAYSSANISHTGTAMRLGAVVKVYELYVAANKYGVSALGGVCQVSSTDGRLKRANADIYTDRWHWSSCRRSRFARCLHLCHCRHDL
jgi:hypothetical protein